MPSQSFDKRLAAVLAEPSLGESPIRGLVEELLDENHKLSRRMIKIGKISDAYQAQLRDAKNELETTKAKLEETLADLNSSYWHLKKIQEVLPVCLECGAVRTGRGSWEPVLEYLKQNSLLLSHGYCPACMPKVMGRWREELNHMQRKK